MKKVHILGTTYRIYTDVSYHKDSCLDGRFGYCSDVEKKIVVGDLATSDSWKNETADVRASQKRLTLRHEIIHAFLNESGLTTSSNGIDCWARNEEMVDWIAIQYPKIKRVFQILKCEE